jgi:hypothetical protein
MSNSRRLRRRRTETRSSRVGSTSGVIGTWLRLKRWLGVGY